MANDAAPWLTGFDEFRAREIDPIIGELEAARHEARNAALKRASWFIPLALLGVGLVWLYLPGDFLIFAAFVAVGGSWAFIQHPIIRHQKVVKEKLVTRLCGFFGLDFCLVPRHDPIPELRRVGLLPSHNRDGREDQVSGVYEGVRLEMTDLHLRQVSGSGKNKRDVTVFRGPVFSFSFAKRFHGTTIIKADATVIGNWFGSIGMGDMERVRLEDPEFEKCFEVYGTNQVEARYLLTPGFMQQLIELRNSLGSKMQAAFDGDSLYIAANNGQDHFEVQGYSGKAVNVQLDRFVGDIGILFRIIRTLNLESKTRL
ncbi:DUF3137 domain-containing protein [Emcibacter sp. SYSU 3D8]|uniref:DUF3137 domain-containing protein n=1 Tax=Emcibacter sp. SYSU 3D8 TaxID=3133969 RepID=UPI0031FEF55A